MPAGAATRTAPPVTHSASTPSFAAEVASLQGTTVTLNDGVKCVVSGTTCTVVNSGSAGTVASGTVLILASTSGGIEQAHGFWNDFWGFTSTVIGVAGLGTAAKVIVAASPPAEFGLGADVGFLGFLLF